MNPWVLLGLTLAWIASVFYADGFGYDRAMGEIAVTRLKNQDKAIVEHNKIAAIDTAEAVRVEEKIIYKRDLAREKRHALELDIERKARLDAEYRAANPRCPARNCDLDPASLGVLVDSIRAANGTKTPAAGDAARRSGADTGAGGRPRGDDPPMAK